MRTLQDVKFEWTVQNDGNRSYEGVALREVFLKEEGLFAEDYSLEGQCSMLELIVSLAIRCESMTADSEYSMSISSWFWKILANCGLDIYTDSDYFLLNGEEKVKEILNIIIDRRYSRNGKGGLFPINGKKKDLRRIELWYQMCFWLVENYLE
jgi:hypothetical protein